MPAAPGIEIIEPIDGPEVTGILERKRVSTGQAYWALFVIVLATFMIFFDSTVFGMLAERIKHDFHLTDSQLGFLAGPAGILIYIFVGIPLARLADIFARRNVLAGGAAVMGVVIALGGFAQTFLQFVGSRVFLAASGSAHAPSSYSLLADAFPPRKLTRAFALLQFGFIGGGTAGALIGGKLVVMSASWPVSHFGPLHMFGWQWIMVWLGLPGLLIGLLFLTVKEPPRLAPSLDAVQPPTSGPLGRRVLTFMGLDALKAINAKPKVYYPLFGALALSAVDSFGLAFWRTPFMVRTYGWNEAQVGMALGPIMLVGSIAGLFFGGLFVEFLGARYKDANVRAAAIFFCGTTICAIASPLMPTAQSSLIVMGVGLMFGIGGAVPQNAAVQRVAPNAMRGQVTAFYLFMFTFFGAMGSFFVGRLQDWVVHDDKQLWKALVIAAATLLPLATLLMVRAIKPYREEIERLEAAELAR